MSHELFHAVNDRRPRAGRATGGTLSVSILAHALIFAAVIVVPLLATDVLPAAGRRRPGAVRRPGRSTATRGGHATHAPHTGGDRDHGSECRTSRGIRPHRARGDARERPRVQRVCRRTAIRRRPHWRPRRSHRVGRRRATAARAAGQAAARHGAEHAEEGPRRGARIPRDRPQRPSRGDRDHRGRDCRRRQHPRRARAALAAAPRSRRARRREAVALRADAPERRRRCR